MITTHCFRSACVGLAAILGGAALTVPAAAQTQDVRPLIERIDRMQRDIDVLQRQLARGGVPAPGSGAAAASAGGFNESFIAQTDSRFSDLESQMRDLTGRVEELSFQIRQIGERLDKLVGDVDYRLGALERGGAPPAAPAPSLSGSAAPTTPPASGQAAAGPAQVPPGQARLVLVPGPSGQAAAPDAAQTAAAPPAAAAAQRVTLPSGPPEQQYEYAYGLLLQAQREQSDFTRPEAALKAFVAGHPTHKLAGNAQYWLGETYYVRKDYQNAVVAFADGLKKYPNSEKGPDNLLKLGMALGQLNQKPNACGALTEIDKRYPNASTSIKQSAQRERQRLGCS